MESPPSMAVSIRELAAADLAEIVRIDALHTGEVKERYWANTVPSFLEPAGEQLRVGLAAHVGDSFAGYLLGEVRAFEFGSEACGWIFAVGVDPEWSRQHVASALLDEALLRFACAGVTRVRTMVRKNDVPVLSFFRASGFEGGSFVQLERDVDVSQSSSAQDNVSQE